jgi:hypothetical protein
MHMQLRAVRAAKRMEITRLHALHRSLLVWAARPLCLKRIHRRHCPTVWLDGLETANVWRA